MLGAGHFPHVDESGAGDFDCLYRTHAPAVLAYCLRRAPLEIAEEAVSETFAVAWRRRDQPRGHELAWLLGIARRVLANQWRSERRRRALSQRLAAEPAPSSVGFGAPPVLEALSSLSDGDREVLRLAAWEGLSSGDAARVLGCSAVAFRLRLHRARHRLAYVLTQLDEHEGKTSPAASPDLRLKAEETP